MDYLTGFMKFDDKEKSQEYLKENCQIFIPLHALFQNKRWLISIVQGTLDRSNQLTPVGAPKLLDEAAKILMG